MLAGQRHGPTELSVVKNGNNVGNRIPQHVAIIMDGNGRWAKARGMQRIEGHAEGARAVRDAVETATRIGIKYLTLYAFSVANWARPRAEVEGLMQLLLDFARRERAELRQNGIRVNVIGALDDLPTTTRHAIEDLMRYTADGDRMTLTLALSYGGRQDIVEAARALAVRARAGLVLPEEIDENYFHKQMTTHELPQVDLLIRTGGETRLSDFLLFESAYAELSFLPIMWPDFRPETLLEAVRDYGQKERRFGMISEQVQGHLPLQAFDPLDRIQN
ncbi:MAG TPA: polyprenyl diphosphate synthase [Polyangiaceae bacterium]|nr:polyprenyl diphosphate synthase [Polyangiaceae bacterium]